jgi:hypothetical protein
VLSCLPPTAETCEELFTPKAPHIDLALAGVEVIANGSGSHHQLRKLDLRLDLIRGATAKVRAPWVWSSGCQLCREAGGEPELADASNCLCLSEHPYCMTFLSLAHPSTSPCLHQLL